MIAAPSKAAETKSFRSDPLKVIAVSYDVDINWSKTLPPEPISNPQRNLNTLRFPNVAAQRGLYIMNAGAQQKLAKKSKVAPTTRQ
jgi:hypothetical protein